MEHIQKISAFLAISALGLMLEGCAALHQASNNLARQLNPPLYGGYPPANPRGYTPGEKGYPGRAGWSAMKTDIGNFVAGGSKDAEQSSLKAKLQAFLAEGTAEANATIEQNGGTLQLVTSIKETKERLTPASASGAHQLEIEFSAIGDREKEMYFGPGEYDTRAKDAEALAIFVTHVVNVIKNRMAGSPVEIRLFAEYFGGADGLPVNSGRFYNGRWGAQIAIPAQQLLLNGVPSNFQLSAGDPITNRSLAVLRAYALYSLFNEYATRAGITNLLASQRFIANESMRVSRGMRFAKIKLTIKERKTR